MDETLNKKKGFKAPSTPVLMIIMIIVLAVLTYVIPAGSFDRVLDEATGIEHIDVNSFHYVEKNPTGPFEVFKYMYDGIVSAADLIFLIFI